MKALKVNDCWVVRLDRGENIISTIKKFCQNHDIQTGYFQAIGAISELTISSYDLENKKYMRKEIKEPLEIASLIGNITTFDSETVIHAHITCGKRDLSTIAGHLDEGIVAATCEFNISPLTNYISRRFNPDIGLNLLDI